MNITFEELPNTGILISSLPENLFKDLLNESLNCENNEIMKSGLTGQGVSKHIYIEKNYENLKKYIHTLFLEYVKKYSNILNVDILTKDYPIAITKPWINHQYKHQFIPHHLHSGIASYTIWMKIPYDSDEQLKTGGKHASCFEFIYNDITGMNRNKTYKLNYKNEGIIMMFPSKLSHCVYPFYENDDVRISISGNIQLGDYE